MRYRAPDTARLAVLGIILLATGIVAPACAQFDLKVGYGANGIQTLTYKNVVLEDLDAYPADVFHIWHMKTSDLAGNAQGGWGESNQGRAWNASTHTWIYTFAWGTVQLQFQQTGNTLDMIVTQTNNVGSGIIFDGATIYPFGLHLPQLPAGFNDPGYPQLTYNTTGPSVTLADFGSGEVAAVAPSAARPLYTGFMPLGVGIGYTPLISGTTPDGLATFQPHNDRPVLPGQTDTFTVSLRFAPSGTTLSSLAADAYQSWAATWPPQLNWTDRRVIGTVYLASSPQGYPSQPQGYSNNPRRYFNDSNASDFDITTAAGLTRFQARILQQAQNNVANLKLLNAQGVITWDIEGEQYPQETSYVCEPDLIAQAAPEMESIVTDPTSPYAGMKLDDAYFKTMRDAGFRIGVCIRPQHFTLNSDGTAQQVYLADAAIPAELTHKMQYAHDRWGATLFYIDSTVETNGAVLDAGIFQQVAAALPDSLLMPEEATPKFYAYTAPFQSFIFHGTTRSDPNVYNYYPNAFSAILVNDVDPNVLAANRSALTASVKRGDLLMAHADYWQANNPTIVQIYSDAGVGTIPPPVVKPPPTPPTPPVVTPPPTPPVVVPPTPPTAVSSVIILSPQAADTVSGLIQVQGQITLNLDAAGSFLMVDGTEIGTRRVSASPFLYPLDTSTLANGTHALQLWAHDTGNNTTLSAPVVITVANTAAPPPPTPVPAPVTPVPSPAPVANAPIAITSPQAAATLSGLVLVQGQITLNLDAAGSFLLVDGVEVGTRRITAAPFTYPLDTSTLNNGPHTLQLWAHDTNNATTLSATIQVTIAN